MEPNLRNSIGREEFDYPALMSALAGYANPRSKVTSLLRKGVIVRVKKGLYVFGDEFRRRPYSLELLANLIYGPSYVSLDSALAYHGLIPERVATITSVTTKREKRFETPVGIFMYRRTPKASFHLGLERVERNDLSFLIASAERALADKLRDDRGFTARNLQEMSNYLFENLRLARDEFLALDPAPLARIGKALGSQKVALCCRLLQKMRTGG